MKQSFEKLQVWQNARQLAKDLGLIFYHKEFRNYGFQDQIMRATISVSNNIAEWNDRESTKEFIRFLYIAKGSWAEVLSMLYIAQDYGYINQEKIVEIQNQVSVLMSQIWKLISYHKLKQ